MLLHGIIQRIFEIMLNICIDGQPQAAALQRDPLGLIALFQRIAPGVHGGEHHPVFPGEQVIVFQFQPADPGVVHVGKAQHRCQKFALGIPALAVLVDADAGDAVFCAEVPHRVGGLPLHPVAQKTVVGSAVTELFQQLPGVQVQQLGQSPGGEVQFIGGHFPGRSPQGPAAAVGCQQNAVRAEDAAPVGGHHRIPQLLPQCAFRVPPAGRKLQAEQPRGQPGKTDTAQKNCHQPCPGAEGAFRQGPQGFGFWHGRHLLWLIQPYAGGCAVMRMTNRAAARVQ